MASPVPPGPALDRDAATAPSSATPNQTPMDAQLAAIFGLTFVIHLVSTLAYSVNIAGTRAKRTAISQRSQE